MTRSSALLARVQAARPAVAFCGGFIWDALTLGRAVSIRNLCMLSGYLVIAAGLLVFMGRRGHLRRPVAAGLAGGNEGADEGAIKAAVANGTGGQHREALAQRPGMASEAGASRPRAGFALASARAKLRIWLRAEGPTFFLQFCFGSLFSALFILYFLSSSYLPGFLVVVALLGLLIANEFLDDQYHRFTLTWALFGTCAILFLNFAIPHVMGSIEARWFFLSTAAGVVLTHAAKLLSPKARGRIWPTYAVALALVGLYLANAIPPVPLVKKTVSICRNLEKRDGVYAAEIEPPPAWAFWRNSESVVRQRPGEKIFCFTSVFAPKGLHCTLFHRWRYDDPRQGWVEASRIGFPISGGRAEGFRGYTSKRNLTPGKWEVRLETETGRLLGEIRFRCEVSADTAITMKNLILD